MVTQLILQLSSSDPQIKGGIEGKVEILWCLWSPRDCIKITGEVAVITLFKAQNSDAFP